MIQCTSLFVFYPNNSFLMRESGPNRGAFCFAKSCLEGLCVGVYVCAREEKKNNFHAQGGEKQHHGCPMSDV